MSVLIWVQTACKDQQQMTKFAADRQRVNEYILFSRIVFGSEMAGTTEQYSRILFMSYMYVSFSLVRLLEFSMNRVRTVLKST